MNCFEVLTAGGFLRAEDMSDTGSLDVRHWGLGSSIFEEKKNFVSLNPWIRTVWPKMPHLDPHWNNWGSHHWLLWIYLSLGRCWPPVNILQGSQTTERVPPRILTLKVMKIFWSHERCWSVIFNREAEQRDEPHSQRQCQSGDRALRKGTQW